MYRTVSTVQAYLMYIVFVMVFSLVSGLRSGSNLFGWLFPAITTITAYGIISDGCAPE